MQQMKAPPAVTAAGVPGALGGCGRRARVRRVRGHRTRDGRRLEHGHRRTGAGRTHDEPRERPGRRGEGCLVAAASDVPLDGNGHTIGATDDEDAPFTDPEAGEPADGRGDAVFEGATAGVSNVHFDSWVSNETVALEL